MTYEEEQAKVREGKRVEVECPDCKALLAILSNAKLPDDIKLEFLKHQ